MIFIARDFCAEFLRKTDHFLSDAEIPGPLIKICDLLCVLRSDREAHDCNLSSVTLLLDYCDFKPDA